MTINRINAKHISVAALVFAALLFSQRTHAQALNMDGQSGIFLQPWAEVVPSPDHKFGGTTASFHMVDAGPVAGDYLNVGLEEGFGNWLEFGYTRNNHTDGGDPTISPLFNFSGMNIFNIKAKLLAANYHNRKYLPAIAVGGVLRTNDPFVVQSVAHKNATNGDVYFVATKLIVLGNKFAFLATGGVRGTNAQKYGYGGNTIDWEAARVRRNRFPDSHQENCSGRTYFGGRPRTSKDQVCSHRLAAHGPNLRRSNRPARQPMELRRRNWSPGRFVGAGNQHQSATMLSPLRPTSGSERVACLAPRESGGLNFVP